MKRWIVWFALGAVIFALGLVSAMFKAATTIGLPALFLLAFGAWLWLTALAVPISIVVWLVRGRRGSTSPAA